MRDESLPYAVMNASLAGYAMGQFTTQATAQAFYDATNGPLPFAAELYRDARLASAFCQAFLQALAETGFPVYASASKQAA